MGDASSTEGVEAQWEPCRGLAGGDKEDEDAGCDAKACKAQGARTQGRWDGGDQIRGEERRAEQRGAESGDIEGGHKMTQQPLSANTR